MDDITGDIPSGYLTVRHGKSPFLIGKPSVSMGHLYHGYVSHNQRVPANPGSSLEPSLALA